MTINVTRSSMPPFEEYCEEIRELWDSHWLTNMGSKHRQLEQELKEFLGCEEIALFTNGHLALENVIEAFRLHGEIITTPFTFASTTHAIVRCGCTPVFCDIDLPVHVYGNLCDVDRIGEIAARHGLPVIYDAAHSFGVFRNGVSSACFGDAAMFSFHATKVFNTVEGGAVCCRSAEIQRRLCDLKNFGIHDEETVAYVGGNAKMNEFCAAMGLCNLRHVDEEIAKRKKVVERYRADLDGIDGLQLNAVQPDVKSNYAYFPVIFEPETFGATRNEVYDALAKENIYARKYFYPLTNTFECFHGQFDVTKTPVALHLSKRVLTLPLYADLELDDVDKICDVIKSCAK